MPIIVLTKKNLLIALVCVALLVGGLFLWLRLRETPKTGETAAVMAPVENYELNVLPMKSRELPVYGVGRGTIGSPSPSTPPGTPTRPPSFWTPWISTA